MELKIKSLQETITKFESKWELSFEEFKKKINDKTLKKDTYSFHVEQDFWLWEEAETWVLTYIHTASNRRNLFG